MAVGLSAPPNGGDVEFIFMGTGTSSSLPNIECVTAGFQARKCKTCLSTLTPEGKKNIRRNTSGVIRMPSRKDPGRQVTIVIDVGKTFQAAAVEWFPKYGLRRIDAVLITHAHADAMNGLDDLRGWTLGGAIQDHIDVYVSQDTFREVNRSFPYLVSKEYASGGGDVPQFVWHIIKSGVSFEIKGTGIIVTPFSVHHGRVFSAPPVIEVCNPYSNPVDMNQSTGVGRLELELDTLSRQKNGSDEIIQPFLCFGFKIERSIVYLSDVSFIPDDIWSLLSGAELCILDCLHLKPHTSHLALDVSIATARRINAKRTYLTGFSHNVSHDEYVTITEAVGGKQIQEDKLTEKEREGLGLVGQGEPFWVRPGHDGLRILLKDGSILDDTYEEVGEDTKART